MEKEMKKLLLVAVSVGVFLLVTITVALIVVTPRTKADESDNSSLIPYSQGRIRPLPDVGDNTEQPIISAERAPVSEPVINITAEAAVADSSDGDKVTIQVTAPAAAAVPASSARTSAAPATSTVKQTPAKTASKTTTTVRTTSAKSVNDYWIQIGAYRAMIRAEDARELLAARGLVSIIENREVNGQNLYRVRLGPYTSEKEANHWLAIVKNIDGFSDSQVRQTIRTQ